MSKTTVKKEEDKTEKKEGKVSPKAELEKGKEEEKKEATESKLEKKKEETAGKRVEPEKKETTKEWDKDKQENKARAEKSVKPKTEEIKKEGTKEEIAEIRNEKASKQDDPNKIEEIIETIKKMTVLELSNLVKALEERFGVVAVAPAPAGMVPLGTPAEEALEKTEWSVLLAAVGEKKIQVIKEVRAVTSLGLKEAKTLVEEAPKLVKEGLPQKEAEEIKAKLEAVGATVELK